jgi:ribonuclease J
VLSELNVPVWGTEFTLAYVEDKLDEHGLLDDADLREMRPNERFKAGVFTIHPIQVTHSLVDCVALAIHTPLGVIIHTGDFKVDPTPTDNKLFDLHTFAEYGKTGASLFQDSTNVERKGYTPSERAVRRKFDEVFAHTKRRLSCFSSSIHRINLAVQLAHEHGRKVAFLGRSMNNSAEIAEDPATSKVPDGLVINPGEMKTSRRKKFVSSLAVLRAPMSPSPAPPSTTLARQDRKGRHRRSPPASSGNENHLPDDRPPLPP